MSIKDRLQEDIKAAMRAKEAERLTTLRLVTAAIKQKEVDERIVLDDAAVLSVLEKMIKQRKDSISQFAAGNRQDLVAKEQAELDILAAYMPEQMSEADLDAAIAAAIAESGASGPQAMGKAMALLKPRLAGKADMGQVSQRLKARLTQ
ncbi:MAG: GatB/YqeY domain-containing protein [Betaproteobacteria bacterium]|nr:GatB/YqeY domain-containing protein [Betaproteobacteria bacterium]